MMNLSAMNIQQILLQKVAFVFRTYFCCVRNEFSIHKQSTNYTCAHESGMKSCLIVMVRSLFTGTEIFCCLCKMGLLRMSVETGLRSPPSKVVLTMQLFTQRLGVKHLYYMLVT